MSEEGGNVSLKSEDRTKEADMGEMSSIAAAEAVGGMEGSPGSRSEALDPEEKQELVQHEKVIARGLGTFFQVGIALSEIKKKELYREEYSTFQEYCRFRWNFQRNYAVRLIRAADITQTLKEEGNFEILPQTEFEARELSGVSKNGLLEGWRKLLNETGNQVPRPEQIKEYLAPYKKARRRGKKADPSPKSVPEEPPKSAEEAESLLFDAQKRLKRFKKNATDSDSDMAMALGELSQIRKFLKGLAQEARKNS